MLFVLYLKFAVFAQCSYSSHNDLHILFIYRPVFLLQQPTSGASGAAPPKKRREPGALTGKNVVVLKPFDVVERHGTVFMPNTIEMAQIKKTVRGQFQTNVQFSSKMTETDIKRILVETFPFLECQR